MNGVLKKTEIQAELPPLTALLVAHAPGRSRPWHRLCWTLDQRLAAVVRRGGEPTIAAIRLAWWDAVLVEGDRSKGGGEPLVEAWRAAAPVGAGLRADHLIDGWRTLLTSDALTASDLAEFGHKRGGALFRLIAGADHPALDHAGAAWALWDLAGHVSDPALAQAALAAARDHVAACPALQRSLAPKPLRLLHGLAVADIQGSRVAKGGFEGRHYRHLLWRSLWP